VAVLFRPTRVARAALYPRLPNLANADWRFKSPADDDYQCIAWAACRVDRHMWPHSDYTWFPGLPLVSIPEEAPVDFFIQGFATLGYEPCESRDFQFGYQKVAIYANDIGVTHMARQHFLGRGWVSKLGTAEDILHRRLEDVEGSMSPLALQYGRMAQILKRSWWSACLSPCLFRCFRHALKFLLCRVAWRALEIKWKIVR